MLRCIGRQAGVIMATDLVTKLWNDYARNNIRKNVAKLSTVYESALTLTVPTLKMMPERGISVPSRQRSTAAMCNNDFDETGTGTSSSSSSEDEARSCASSSGGSVKKVKTENRRKVNRYATKY